MTTEEITRVETTRVDATPLRPSAVGRSDLDEAWERGRAARAASVAWADGGAVELVAGADRAVADLVATCRLAPLQRTGHLVDDDGTDVVVPGALLDDAGTADVLHRGGGILLAAAEDRSALARTLVARLATGWEARVGALALLGSEPGHVLGPQVARTCVVALTRPVIVHDEAGVPFDAEVGRPVTVAGLPRVIADPESLTLLLVEPRALPGTVHALLADRARFHPRLRLDAPLAPDVPVPVLGSPDTSYHDLVADEVAALVAAAPIDEVLWWWRLAQRAEPHPRATGPGCRAVGRMNAGLGVARPDEGVLHAGGVSLVVPDARRDLVLALLAGEAVACGPEDEGAPSLDVLATCGLVEVVDG